MTLIEERYACEGTSAGYADGAGGIREIYGVFSSDGRIWIAGDAEF